MEERPSSLVPPIAGESSLGACRTLLAEASSLDGISWRVRPFVRHWR